MKNKRLLSIGLVLLVFLVVLFSGLYVASMKLASAADSSARDMRVEQVKIFSGDARPYNSYFYNAKDSLENQVNNWISADNGKIEIIRVLQSQGEASDFAIITIFYKKTE